jgi:hypothetical protein
MVLNYFTRKASLTTRFTQKQHKIKVTSSLEIISLSLTNLKITGGLHGR